MDDLSVALRFAVAIGLGMLLGMERQRAQGGGDSAGVRTFALIALTGALAGYLQAAFGLELLAIAIFVTVALLTGVAYVFTALRGDIGLTSEISVLLTFLLGFLCALDQLQVAAWLGVTVALLLALKNWLHGLAKRIESADVEATLKFLIVTLIILPLVPNENYGPVPLDVLNPYKIWLMVVLISGLNFASYVLIKALGAEHGIGIAGLLGGLVSSTAVTLGFAQRSRQSGSEVSALALGIFLAWTVMFLRVPVMGWLISPALGLKLLVPMALLCVVSLGISGWLWRRHRSREKSTVEAGANPFELSEAVKFGVLFGVVLFVARAAQVWLGDAGLYLAAGVAGLTDIDAITLAMADLARNDAGMVTSASRAILIAAMANTSVKAGMAIGLGSEALRRQFLPLSGLLLATGIVAVLVL